VFRALQVAGRHTGARPLVELVVGGAALLAGRGAVAAFSVGLLEGVRAVKDAIAFARVLVVLPNGRLAGSLRAALVLALAGCLVQLVRILAFGVSAVMHALASVVVCVEGELTLDFTVASAHTVLLLEPHASWTLSIASALTLLPISSLLVGTVKLLWRALGINNLAFADLSVGFVPPWAGLE
jgi:hypothetical protein